ncbi:MAG: CPBP family intramembrane metalloprotease [Methanomassiliicoccaceae archaeon]|jgi:hypothetical protein|nr:CPBP family intramembrane metalloprotease [Methanomassiliicoccaceae archaeon]
MTCGRPVAMPASPPAAPKDDTLTNIVRIAGIVTLIACTAMLIFEICTVFWGFGDIWANVGSVDPPIVQIFVVVPFIVRLFSLTGALANAYYLFLVIAVLVSFVLLMYNSREGFAGVLKGKFDKLDGMPLYAVVTLFVMYLSLNMILIFIVTAFGYDPAVPPMPDGWELWYLLLNASVWEEIICRVLIIGIPLIILGYSAGENGSLKRLFGRCDMNKAAVVLIIASSAIFALAHAGGWDLFKVIPTFVSGLALGYLFVRYGLHAAIMLHFMVDYLSSFVWVYDSLTADMMLGLFILAIIVLGIPFILLYAKRGYEYVKEMFSL